MSIASHRDLLEMIYEYATYLNFKYVMFAIALGKREEPYAAKDNYLLYGNRLCVTHSIHDKVIHESHACPYAVHREIQAMLKGVEVCFYWSTMKKDKMAYVSSCMVYQKVK